MSLRDVRLKATYDSDSDDILSDFYIPALSVSMRYRRLAGFFSSSALAIAARGIAQFVRNGGERGLVWWYQRSGTDFTLSHWGENQAKLGRFSAKDSRLVTVSDLSHAGTLFSRWSGV